jgi:hypothetical protein
VTINGFGFVNGASVTFGGLAATAVVAQSNTTITCFTPQAPQGTVDVTVTNPNGSSATLVGQFSFATNPAQKVAERLLTIPTHHWLSEKDKKAIADCVGRMNEGCSPSDTWRKAS